MPLWSHFDSFRDYEFGLDVKSNWKNNSQISALCPNELSPKSLIIRQKVDEWGLIGRKKQPKNAPSNRQCRCCIIGEDILPKFQSMGQKASWIAPVKIRFSSAYLNWSFRMYKTISWKLQKLALLPSIWKGIVIVEKNLDTSKKGVPCRKCNFETSMHSIQTK